MVLFLSKYLKKPHEPACNYVLKDVKKFIEQIKLMEEKTNLNLLEDFFQSSSKMIMQKCLLILKIEMKTKKL